jgi:hypothetical protein
VLADYFGALKVGEAVREAKIRALLLGHDAVVGCERTASARCWSPSCGRTAAGSNPSPSAR